jgi:hypothetical protein
MEQRSTWTSERLDDLAEGMRTGFARLDQDNRDMRAEMSDGFRQMRAEMSEMRGELRGEINELRVMMFRIGGAMMVGLIGVIAAILARGA